MAAKTSLRDYQRDLAERLRSAEAGRMPSKLGVQVGDERWLVDLADAAEVIPVPPLSPIPLTRSWFKGMVNIRGNLYAVADFPAFLGHRPAPAGDQARLLILSERFRLGAALLVDRSLGLRAADDLECAGEIDAPWARAEYVDREGLRWRELDLPQLAAHPDFLSIGL